MVEESVEIQNLSANDAVYFQDKAVIDMQVSTAKAYPRNIKRSMENAIATVTMDVQTAQTCNYAVPRGGKVITGPSVHLAKVLAQCWGNMRVETKVISIEDRQVTSQAIAFDLENNVAIKVEVKKSIMTRSGRMSDDMITVTGNATNSIALRNAIFSVIPKAVVDRAYNASKEMVTGDVSDKTKLIKKRTAVFDGFKDTYGVAEKDVLSVIGKAALDHVTADDLVVLIGIGQAIKDGDTTVDEAFKAKQNTVANTTAKKEELKAKLTAESKPEVKPAETPKQETKPTEEVKSEVKVNLP